MLRLNRASIRQQARWQQAGIEMPSYKYDDMVKNTEAVPSWVHFGAGNIFRGYIALLQQQLLEQGLTTTGIVAVEMYDHDIINKMYRPYDNLGLLVTMHSDGKLAKQLIAGIAQSLVGDPSYSQDWALLKAVFTRPSLQMASFTITEKGYNLTDPAGAYLPEVANDLAAGPSAPQSAMAKIAALVYERYLHGAQPLALVSMDNCSHNGERLQQAIITIAMNWQQQNLVEQEFIDYLSNPNRISFPWTMIDKITPRPSTQIKLALEESGFGSTDIVCTAKNTFIAPFVNAEQSEYLVVEDCFPNGRPPLEQAGVYFTDRQTVNRVETMKVCTCLNPLHTALAVFGCLLGYNSIAQEMQDPDLRALVEQIGYAEGMPVVTDPGIINPVEFIREVITVRLSNPYIPDTPQRIAADTSQKISIRFGGTLKAYQQNPDLDPQTLVAIPLVLACWCRYLLGIDDHGRAFEPSPDPLMPMLQQLVSPIKFGQPGSVTNNLRPLLANPAIFGLDLYSIGLGDRIEEYVAQMIVAPGAVRNLLHTLVDRN